MLPNTMIILRKNYEAMKSARVKLVKLIPCIWHLEDNHVRGRKFKICKEHFIEHMGLMEEDIGMYMLSYHIFE